MGKGFFDDSKPGAVAGEFATCEQGTHEVCGIEWVKTENQFPVYVPDTYRGVVARVRFIRCDGGINPIGSFTPGELTLMVKAFGGDPKALPKDRTTSAFLVKVEELIGKATEAGKRTTVYVNEKGWVSSVTGATMPEGFYSFQVVNAKSLDGSEPLHFMEGTKKEFKDKTIRVTFKVTGNTLGKPTIYDGLTVTTFVSEAWDGDKNGAPSWKLTPNGAKCAAAMKMIRFISAYLPYFDHEWESDPTRSEYGINELENPIVVVMDKAIKEGRSVPMQYKPNKNGNMVVDLTTLVVDDLDSVVEETTEPEDTGDVYVVGSNIFNENFQLCEFANYIHVKCPGAFVTYPVSEASELVLSEVGRTWANEHFPPIWQKAGLEPKAMPISAITKEMATALLGVINDDSYSTETLWA